MYRLTIESEEGLIVSRNLDDCESAADAIVVFAETIAAVGVTSRIILQGPNLPGGGLTCDAVLK